MSWYGFPVEGLALLNDLEPQTQQLFDALTERAYAVRMNSLSNNTPINFPSAMPVESLQRIPWRAWQNLARGQCFSFLHPDKVPGGPDYSLEGVDHPTHGTASFGYNAALFFYSSFAEIYEAADLHADGFTRKRPWHISDADPPEGIHALGGNPIVKREAGAWVPAPNRGHPDLKTEHGLALPGDTIGPWLWNEMRDVLNLMQVSMVGERYTYYFGDNGGLRRDYGSGLNRETPQEAIDAAIANGQDASGGGGNVLAFAALSYYDYSNPPWSVWASSRQSNIDSQTIHWFADAPEYDLDFYGIVQGEGQTGWGPGSGGFRPEMLSLQSATPENSFVKLSTIPDAKGESPNYTYAGRDFSVHKTLWPPVFRPIEAGDFIVPSDTEAIAHAVTGAQIYSGPAILWWKFEFNA